MDKKYYELIITLIKEHRKYAGCESILDSIADDVYAHAKTIIETVDNEEVITTYLKKLVATSIVTVPKRMNINTRSECNMRDIEDLISSVKSDNNSQQKTTENINGVIGLNDRQLEVATEQIANVDTIVLENPETTEQIFDNEIDELSDVVETNIVVEEISIDNEIKNGQQFFNNDIQEDTIPQNETLIENIADDNSIEVNGTIEEEEEDIVTPLVHKMINGLDSDESVNKNPSLSSENDETFELNDEYLNNIDELNNCESVEEELENIEIPEVNSLDDQSELELLELNTDEVPQAEFVKDTTGDKVIDDKDDLEAKNNFNIPNYECFNFVQEENNINTNAICAELENYDNQYPEKQILKICDLKYNVGLSVSQISVELNLPEQTIVEILYDIINLVKD